MSTVVSYVLKKEKRGGHQQKEYPDVHGKRLGSGTCQTAGNVRVFVKHWCWDEVGVETDGLSSCHGREAVKEMSRSVTKV